MAVSIVAPLVHVEDANGLPYVGALQYIYEVNTTTLRPIFTDVGLSIPAANPQTSNAKGDFPRVFTAEGSYKIRQEQKPIPPLTVGTLIAEWDDVDSGLSAGTVALPISRGGTGGTTAAAARANLDVPSNSELADIASDIAAFTGALNNLAAFPQGRLTLTSGTPVLAANVTAASTVYYTPYTGQLCPVWDGAQFNLKVFAELSLTLNSNHVLNSIYDVYVINDVVDGVVLVTSPAWSNIAAGTGSRLGTCDLARLQGLWVNSAQLTMRNGGTTYTVAANEGTYVGSLFMDGSAGQVSCLITYGTSRKWAVWNAYNRRPIVLKAGPATANWTPAAAASGILAANNTAANSLTTFSGLPEEVITLISNRKALVTTTPGTGEVTAVSTGIGVNSTTAYSGQNADLYLVGATGGSVSLSTTGMMLAHHTLVPGIGINTITACEATITNGSVRTMYGTEASFLLKAEWLG